MPKWTNLLTEVTKERTMIMTEPKASLASVGFIIWLFDIIKPKPSALSMRCKIWQFTPSPPTPHPQPAAPNSKINIMIPSVPEDSVIDYIILRSILRRGNFRLRLGAIFECVFVWRGRLFWSAEMIGDNKERLINYQNISILMILGMLISFGLKEDLFLTVYWIYSIGFYSRQPSLFGIISAIYI